MYVCMHVIKLLMSAIQTPNELFSVKILSGVLHAYKLDHP